MITEPLFKEDDYIASKWSGDMAIIKGVTKKGYYSFKAYYSAMFDELKDLKKYKYELQVDYQESWHLATEEEKKKLDKIIKDAKNGE